MTTFRISVEAVEVYAGLKAMSHRGSHLHEVFKGLRPDLRRELKEHASAESGPEGAWKPRAASTLGRLDKRGAFKTVTKREKRRKVDGVAMSGPLRSSTSKKALAETLGRLPGGVVTKVEPRALIARSPVAWAGVHNEGGRVGNGTILPARPFVFMSDSFLKQAERDLIQFVIGGFEK